MSPEVLLLAYVLDVTIGDPHGFPHPVRGMGWLIQRLEARARALARGAPSELAAGAVVVLITVSTACVAAQAMIQLATTFGLSLWMEALIAWTTLATRSLDREVRKVLTLTFARSLSLSSTGDLDRARAQLTRVVGRDTESLDQSEIARALVETVAESASDGVVAPLLFLALGGPVAAMGYKAVNTLDSMIGHPEPPYRYLGAFAARLDDVCNFVPARLTALGIVLATFFAGGGTGAAGRAFRIWRRDGDAHPSPNAGQPEAAMAGALGVCLGGINRYDGVPQERPLLGAELRPPRLGDARRSLRILWLVSAGAFLCALACSYVRLGNELR